MYFPENLVFDFSSYCDKCKKASPDLQHAADYFDNGTLKTLYILTCEHKGICNMWNENAKISQPIAKPK